MRHFSSSFGLESLCARSMKRRIERSEMGRGSWSRRASFSDAEARNLRFEPAQHLARRCETRRQFHACAHRVRERVQHQQFGSPHEQGGALAHRQRQRTSSTPGARSRDDLSSHSSTAGSSSAISQNLTRGEHGKVASPFHTPTGDTHPPGSPGPFCLVPPALPYQTGCARDHALPNGVYM